MNDFFTLYKLQNLSILEFFTKLAWDSK